MAHERPPEAVDTAQRQLRTVRRWHNIREAQRGASLLVAIVATAATAIVLLGLFASVEAFATLAWAIVAATLVTTWLAVAEVRRHWLGAAAVVGWVDERGELGGRLRTLVELSDRGRISGETFFGPLLAAENTARLPSWAPRRLIPHRIPRGALGLAGVTLVVLLVTLALAPAVRVVPPEILFSDEPRAGHQGGPTDAMSDRVVVAPGAGAVDGAGRGADDDRSLLARLPGDIQERIRERLWGEQWDRMRQALAQADRTPEAQRGAGSSDPAPGEDPWETVENPAEAARRGTPADDGSTQQPALPPPGGLARRDPDSEAAGQERLEKGTGPAANADAGNTTDPNLFGAATDTEAAATGSFEIALATRMRAGPASQRRRAEHAPDAAPDDEPELTRSRRREVAAHKMPVPAAYERIVREVFAHRPTEREASP